MGFQTPGFDPGPSPDDWAGLEARRAEREQRGLGNPHGREISGRSRRIAGWTIALMVIGFLAAVLLGWIDVFPP